MSSDRGTSPSTLRARAIGASALFFCTAVVVATLAAAPAAAAPKNHVTLVGLVEALPAGLIGDWTVAGRLVHVTAATAVDQSKGEALVGSLVQVKGQGAADGSVNAAEITVLRSAAPQPRPRPNPRRVEVVGMIMSLPGTPDFVGDWIVNERLVHVAATTELDQRLGAVAVGAFVLVRGTAGEDGSVDAARIEVKKPAAPRRECDFAVLHLTPAETAPEGAEGVVLTRKIVLPNGTAREDIKVAVEHLTPDTSYDVVIDGINAGLLMTNEEGEGHLFLSSADIPGAEPLPAELSPVSALAHVEVQASGEPVLIGDLADANRHGCGSAAPDYLAIAVLLAEDGSPLGVAMVVSKNSQQTLRVAAWSLPAGAPVNLVVDGVSLGTFTPAANGTLHVAFSTSPGGGQLPLPIELQPVNELIQVELQAEDATPIASGSFAPVPGP